MATCMICSADIIEKPNNGNSSFCYHCRGRGPHGFLLNMSANIQINNGCLEINGRSVVIEYPACDRIEGLDQNNRRLAILAAGDEHSNVWLDDLQLSWA